jgi:glycosyltransferase involved in cell wall biosynthesis
MITGPKFSIIIPSYNRAYILQKSINSLLAQTCADYELIVVDDGSSDHTPRLMRGILDSGRAGTDRIRYVRQEQQGKSAALNHGVRIATGDWIAFLDSDDIWLPSKLEWQLLALQQFGNCDACFTDARYTNNPRLNITAFRRAGRQHEGTLGIVPDALEFVINEPHGIHIQTVVVRASRMREVGGFDCHLRVLEDHDFVFRMARALTRFCYVNRPLVEIDRTANRDVGLIELLARDEIRLEQQQYMYEKWLRTEGLDMAVRRKIHKHLRAVYSGWANWHLEQREYDLAREAMVTAIQHNFTARMAMKWVLTVAAPAVTRRHLLQRNMPAQPDPAN